MAVDRGWWDSLDDAWKDALRHRFEFKTISDEVLRKISTTTHLDVAQTKITSLAPAGRLDALEVVDISGCDRLQGFTGLPPSVKFVTFQWIHEMSDLSWVDALPNLEKAYGPKDLQKNVNLRIGKNRRAAVKAGPAVGSGGPAGETLLYTFASGEKLAKHRQSEYYGLPIAMAPPGAHASFIRGERGSKAFIVSGGVKGDEWDDVRLISWTPDGTRPVYVGVAGKKEQLVVGRAAAPAVDKVVEYNFGPKGQYAVVTKSGKKMLVVEPGAEHSPFDFVCNLLFDDAGRVHYDANRGGTPDRKIQDRRPTTTGQWFHVEGGRERAIDYERVGDAIGCTWDYGTEVTPNYAERTERGVDWQTLERDCEFFGRAVRVVKQGKQVLATIDSVHVGAAYDKFHLLCGSRPGGWLRLFATRGPEVFMIEHALSARPT
jgi:hypothetical protein